jgi:hypothetical protein
MRGDNRLLLLAIVYGAAMLIAIAIAVLVGSPPDLRLTEGVGPLPTSASLPP